jgi:peptide chain release factor subunit 3
MLQNGQIDDRKIEKFKKEAKERGKGNQWLAYAVDLADEEKTKGITVEVGHSTFFTETKQFTVFDAPGHKNYVPNMIIGTVFADYAGLVISAKEGEYEMGFKKEGQTREHIHIAKILGVEQVIVVVTKMDDPTVNWSETRFNNIKANLTPFLIKRGYREDRISFVPISGITGQNVLEPIGDVCPWYKGMTLIQILDKLPFKERDPNDPLRIPIIDKMTDKGVIAHGKIESGMVRVGDKVMISPSGYHA